MKKRAEVVHYDMGDVMGDIAGDSSRVCCDRTAMMPGIGLASVLVFGAGLLALPFMFAVVLAGGVVDSSSSSKIGGQYVLRTCLRAGRRIGFDRKKSCPIHSIP